VKRDNTTMSGRRGRGCGLRRADPRADRDHRRGGASSDYTAHYRNVTGLALRRAHITRAIASQVSAIDPERARSRAASPAPIHISTRYKVDARRGAAIGDFRRTRRRLTSTACSPMSRSASRRRQSR